MTLRPAWTTRTLRFAGTLLLVLFGIWAGFRVYSIHGIGGVARSTRPPPAAIRVPAGEASLPTASDFDTPFEAGLPPAKIPEHLPDFSLGDTTGKPTPVSTWRGKSLILNFWATWCAPCRHEMPLLQSLSREWQGRGVEVVGIAVDYREKVLAYADELKITYPLLIGEEDALDVAKAFGVASPVFPFTVFTDRRGEIVTLFVGELHKTQADLILSVVQSLDQERAPRMAAPANRLLLADARHRIELGLHALAKHPAPGAGPSPSDPPAPDAGQPTAGQPGPQHPG